jgi:hypothetical protein
MLKRIVRLRWAAHGRTGYIGQYERPSLAMDQSRGGAPAVGDDDKMTSIDRGKLKSWALAIVSEVDPEDKFVVEDNFDALIDNWDAAQAQDEGRFVGGPEVAAFAGIVGPFLLGFFSDVAKDAVKDQTKKLVGKLLDKLLARNASADEAKQLHDDFEEAIAESRFPEAQKAVLRKGFEALISKLYPRPQPLQ